MITITVNGGVLNQSTNANGDTVLTLVEAVPQPQVDLQQEEATVAEDVAHAAEVEAETFVASVPTAPVVPEVPVEPTPVQDPSAPLDVPVQGV